MDRWDAQPLADVDQVLITQRIGALQGAGRNADAFGDGQQGIAAPDLIKAITALPFATGVGD